MGAPQLTGPTFIDPVTHVAFTNGSPQSPILFAFGGNLYMGCSTSGTGPGGNNNGTGVYKSTDNGNTWTELDAAHAPVSQGETAVFLDSVNSRLVFAFVTSTFPVTAQPIFLQAFNLLTGLWGSAFATGGPNATTVVQFCFQLPNGTIRAIYDFGSSNPGGTSRLRAADWNGTSWSSSIDIGAGILPFDATGNILVSDTAAAVDLSGNLHLAFTNNTKTVVMYQQVLENGTLGPSNRFTGISFNTSVAVLGTLVVSGNNILISSTSNAFVNNIILLGQGLAAPVWSTVSPAALASAGGLINLPGSLATDGVNLLWMVNFTDVTLTYNYYQLAKSVDNGNTWNLLPDNTTSPYFYNFAPGTSPLAPNLDATFGALNPVLAILSPGSTTYAYGFVNVRNTLAGAFRAYYMNAEALGAAIVANAFEISLFGVKRLPKPAEPERTVCPDPPKVKLFC